MFDIILIHCGDIHLHLHELSNECIVAIMSKPNRVTFAANVNDGVDADADGDGDADGDSDAGGVAVGVGVGETTAFVNQTLASESSGKPDIAGKETRFKDKHSLDSDEEDVGEKYNVLHEDDIEGVCFFN